MARICIETDAALIVKMINGEIPTNWKYTYWIRRVKRLLSNFDTIRLILREQNMAADSLAKLAVGMNEKEEFYSMHEKPRNIRRLYT